MLSNFVYDNIKFSNWTHLSCVMYKNLHIPDFLSEEQLLMGFQKFPKISFIMESGFPHMRQNNRENKTDIKTRTLIVLRVLRCSLKECFVINNIKFCVW